MPVTVDDLRVYDQSEKMIGVLSSQGLKVVQSPISSRIPRLPADLTSLQDGNLMDLWTKVTSWVDYLSVQVACAQIDERDAQKQLDYAEAQAMVQGWTGSRGDRVAIAKAQQALDPNVIAKREDLDDKHAYRKLIETMTANLERDAALISRELTRRTTSVASRGGKYA